MAAKPIGQSILLDTSGPIVIAVEVAILPVLPKAYSATEMDEDAVPEPTESVLVGVEEERPRKPVAPTQVNCPRMPAVPKRTVEDASRPPRREIFVPVALPAVAKVVPGVQAKTPVPVHDEPVPVKTPIALACTQPVMFETTSFEVLALPTILTLSKNVDVAIFPAVVEPIFSQSIQLGIAALEEAKILFFRKTGVLVAVVLTLKFVVGVHSNGTVIFSDAPSATDAPPETFPVKVKLLTLLESIALVTLVQVMTPSALSESATWLVQGAEPAYAETRPVALARCNALTTPETVRTLVLAFAAVSMVVEA